MLYPNQRGIKIHREIIKKEYKEPFLTVKSSNLFYAMRDLSNSAFKVYIYFISNKNDYIMGISPAAINNETGVCVETARKAVKELEIKGYIVMSDYLKFQFYEVPHKNINGFGLEEKKNEWLEIIEKSDYKDTKQPIQLEKEDEKEEWFY